VWRGRVVDADSGQPVTTAFIGYSSVNAANQQLGAMNFTGIQTDANGKFRLDGIQPGHYSAFVMGMGQDNSSYSDPAPFDVSDGDVTGIEIKVRRGLETYGGKGESLVKGVVVNLSAIALSVKPGGSIERVQILGGLLTHGPGVEALEPSRGGQESCGGGTCKSALGRMTGLRHLLP